MTPPPPARRPTAIPGRAAALVPLCLAALLTGLGAAPASADDSAYRYWSFWTWDGDERQWAYATQGPGTLRVRDGDVLGFRFAVSAESSDTRVPRGAGDFGAVCGDGGEGADGGGGERVALVIDFGTPGDAPGSETPPEARTECAEVDGGATAAEALAGVAEPLRYNSDALLCAIAGYPARGCADQLSEESGGDASDSGDGGGSAVAVLAGTGTVAALAVAAWIRARRRR
ncbi:SCO2322 family protein [Streptomyces sp. NBC_01803]|uniref:SCO2322 family protein n=1 Tax=Streptomyces sp. NBC_01803 TaxID=2975946 RepID=UPI002DD9C0E9|nr:SCO2322 family protein [Streptomyces sp. NBC_01803]WSA46429.1 SCO2322 family protein [Streptomyces sp. NBC_01803]